MTNKGAALPRIAILCAILATPPGFGGQQTSDGLKARVQSLQTKRDRVTVILLDKRVVRGQIVRVDEDSFVVQEENSNRETVVPFAQLKDIKGASSGGHKKAILISAAIVGGAVLVLCAAPYPIGFLCHKDPS